MEPVSALGWRLVRSQQTSQRLNFSGRGGSCFVAEAGEEEGVGGGGGGVVLSTAFLSLQCVLVVTDFFDFFSFFVMDSFD